MNAERPCHISDAWGREFEQLVAHLRGSIYSCGEDHARGVARVFGGCGHDAEVLMRCAIADVANERAL